MNSARPNVRRTDQNLHEAMGTRQFVPIMDGWGVVSWIAITLAIGLFWYFAWSVFGVQ